MGNVDQGVGEREGACAEEAAGPRSPVGNRQEEGPPRRPGVVSPEEEAPGCADGALLARWRAGDAAAFERLVDRWQRPLLRLAAATVRDPGAAEDAVQETFLRLIRQAPQVGSNGAVGAWLFRVCRNVALDAMKTEARERRRREAVAAPEEVPSAPLPERAELQVLAGRELERLPAKQRDAVRMKVLSA